MSSYNLNWWGFIYIIGGSFLVWLGLTVGHWYDLLLGPVGVIIGFYVAFFEKRSRDDSILVEVGKCENATAWATFYAPARIRIQGSPREDADVQQQYCRAIPGLDHEYFHEILHRMEGNEASKAFDNLAPKLTDHILWVGLNLTVEGSTRDFWNSLDP